MEKYNFSSEMNEREKTEPISNVNKINQSSIIDKIHSIQASLNTNNKSKILQRKNNFKRSNEPWAKDSLRKSKTKIKNSTRSKSNIKHNMSKNKIKNNSQDINKNNSLYNNIKFNYNNSLTEQSNCSNNTNNSFFTNNTTNNGLNTNNNIIITINNYNKISPTNTEQSSKTIQTNKSKDRSNVGGKKKEIKKIKYNNSIGDNSKKYTKQNLHKNKKDGEKKVYNYYLNGHNLSVDNGQNNVYNNNVFFNQMMSNRKDDNNDNVSINTYHTINESNNNISSNISNYTTNREYSNKTLIKKNNNYQDNIILKKKQLGMYSPLSILKKNFDISNQNANNTKYNNFNMNNQYCDTVNSFNATNDKNAKYDENLNINQIIENKNSNNNNINEKNMEKNYTNNDLSNNIEKRDNIITSDENKNRYNFNYFNINKNNNINNNINNSNMPNEDNNTLAKSSNNPNNTNTTGKGQVKNILSTINRIKNTKQIYNNKKALEFTKYHRKRERQPLYTNNHSFLKSRPSYSRLYDRNVNNNHIYYSRSNSKNVLNNRSNNFKFLNFSQKKASKSNQKLLDRSFMSENDGGDKKKSTNSLLLSYQKKRNKMYIFKNVNNQKKNNKSEGSNNDADNKKINADNNDDNMTINTSINSNKNLNYFNIKNKDSNNNMVNSLNKNNTSYTVSVSKNIDNSKSDKSNNKIIDTYESSTIANINKHCDSLLSRINFKMKEKANNDNRDFSKSNDNENNENGEEEEDNNKMKIINNINSIEIENQNKNIYKKIISNASLSRKGLNRPDEQMKINQDTLFKVKFGDINYSYYGVCDGHGPSGHFVSDFIKSNIAFIVYKQLKSLLLQNNNNNISNLNSASDANIDFPKLFKDCFLLMDSKLTNNKSIDIELSGTTCVSLLFCDNRIISANVGDSRAIKGQYNISNKKWGYIALSRDHKPSEKDEAERIHKYKGIIHPYIDDDGNYAGPDRVWIDDEELPGLAMSRSFGDEIAARAGVYAEPEVKIFPFEEKDKFVVIASDGLWEYVTNEEVIDIVSEYFEKKDCDGAVSKLYEVSHERWVQYDDYIDDISIIVVFLD